MRRFVLAVFFAFAAFVLNASGETGYEYKGSAAAAGPAGVKALIVLAALGAAAFFVPRWLKKNGLSTPSSNPGITAAVSETRIAADKKIVVYERAGITYILGVTKDGITTIDRIAGKGRAKKNEKKRA